MIVLAQTDIPYNSDFPDAQYPYAQAPDGCSSLSNNPQQVRDTWGPVNFKPACDQHDRCYYTYGSRWQQCNEQYLKELERACWNDLRTWVPPVKVAGYEITPGFFLPPDPARLSLCYSVATTYYAGVQAGVALQVFNNAQRRQKKYDDWAASIYCFRGSIFVNSAYVGSTEAGTLTQPFKDLQTAYERACVQSEIRLIQGEYSVDREFDKPVILIAENGVVIIGK